MVWQEILTSAISGAIAGGLGGLWANYYSGNRTATQNLASEYVAELCTLVETVALDAETYWSVIYDAERHPILETKLTSSLHRLSSRLENLKDYGWQFDNDDLHDLLDQFHEAITDGNFQVVNRQPEIHRIGKIHRSGDELISAVRFASKRAIKN